MYASGAAHVAGFALDWRIDEIAGTLGLRSHLVRVEDLIFGNKIPISWTAAKCQRCLLSS